MTNQEIEAAIHRGELITELVSKLEQAPYKKVRETVKLAVRFYCYSNGWEAHCCDPKYVGEARSEYYMVELPVPEELCIREYQRTLAEQIVNHGMLDAARGEGGKGE